MSGSLPRRSRGLIEITILPNLAGIVLSQAERILNFPAGPSRPPLDADQSTGIHPTSIFTISASDAYAMKPGMSAACALAASASSWVA
jgi:hypothetical protein